MAQQPMSQSDTLGLHAQKTAPEPEPTLEPGPEPSPEPSSEFNLAEFPSPPADAVQAALLAEVPAVSVDLLNDIVERARSATNASGAAIALGPGDDIVCLAETGTSAPSVGARLNLNSGLSGACVQSKTFQRCDDSETDPRVDPELCRRLGVRSMLVFPILRRDVLLGLVEVFSPNAHAFSDREVEALASLSRTISYILDGSAAATQQVPEEPPLEAAPEAVVPAVGQQVPEAPPLEVTPEAFVAAEETVPHEELLGAVSEAEVALPATPKQDYWTTALTAAVIVLAIALGWLLGRGGLRRSASSPNNPAPTQQGSLPQQSTPVPPSAPAVSPPAAEEKPLSPPPAASKHEPAVPPNPHAGELVISQNGKVIYRQPGSQPESATNPPPAVPNSPSTQTGVSNAVRISSETANQFLVQRVEPEYPESARDQRIQGPVTLEAVVGKDGSVKTLKTVSGDPQLAAAARHAVSQWRFKPLLRDGKPVEFQTQVTVNFRLP